MRFSTTNSVSLTHPDTSLTISFKKVILSLRSKLPRQHKVSPIKNNAHTVIKVAPKRQNQACAKQQDIYHSLRNYYGHSESNQQETISTIEKSDREARHKIVKQYQQQDTSPEHRHWKEYSSPSFVDTNTDAPLKFQTHAYIRDTRINGNFLRIAATKKHAQDTSQMMLTNTDKPYLKKRTDEFLWARPSTLRQEI
ncbi:hypothetical protein BD560DRAFT_425057 [Blakeslea trispora]|nr:hypothetical protein BD560DRAFT_425057 [Blakeslea trispora]